MDPIDLDRDDDEARAAAAAAPPSRGFLPIATHWVDRLFIAIYVAVALELLWMRFLEQALPLWVCHIVVLALGAVIVRRG